MAIRVQYQPSASAVGGAAYAAGVGAYRQQQQQMAQQLYMQERSLQAQAAAQQRQIEASQAAQQRQYEQQQEMSLFDAYNRQRLAQMQYATDQQRLNASNASAVQKQRWAEENADAALKREKELYDYKENAAVTRQREELDRQKQAAARALQNGVIQPYQYDVAMAQYEMGLEDLSSIPMEKSILPRGREPYSPWKTPEGSEVMFVPDSNGGYSLEIISKAQEKTVEDPTQPLQGPKLSDKYMEVASKIAKMEDDYFNRERELYVNQKTKWDAEFGEDWKPARNKETGEIEGREKAPPAPVFNELEVRQRAAERAMGVYMPAIRGHGLEDFFGVTPEDQPEGEPMAEPLQAAADIIKRRPDHPDDEPVTEEDVIFAVNQLLSMPSHKTPGSPEHQELMILAAALEEIAKQKQLSIQMAAGHQ